MPGPAALRSQALRLSAPAALPYRPRAGNNARDKRVSNIAMIASFYIYYQLLVAHHLDTDLYYIIFSDSTRSISTLLSTPWFLFPPKMAKDASDDIIYSDESSFPEEPAIVNPEPPLVVSAVIANWWLNEKLGSGYSGAWSWYWTSFIALLILGGLLRVNLPSNPHSY